MAIGGGQITRLGVSAWPTKLYGSFSGKVAIQAKIDGLTTFVLTTANHAIVVVSDGTNWHIVADYDPGEEPS